jgi:hypothetical protein
MNATAWRMRIGRIVLPSLLAGWLIFTSITAQAIDQAAGNQMAADNAVREALQREVYGLEGDRQRLLDAATSAAPDHELARWHQGYVRDAAGNWSKAADAPKDIRRQALLRQYDKVRAATADTVTSQLELADWCEKHNLDAQERAHLTRICELSPDHPSARQRLGFTRVGREWVSRDEVSRQQRKDDAAREALAHWTPIISKLALQLSSRSESTRRFAVQQLKQIHDPAALPALHAQLASKGEEHELLTVDITAQMTDPDATASLARQAVFSSSLRVRKAAAEKLKICERDHFVPLLVSSMYTPVVSQVAMVSLPNGRLGYRHAFLREGSEKQEMLVLDTEYRRVNRGGTQDNARAMATLEAQATAATLERAADRQNASTRALNDRIAWVLGETTGVKLPAQPDDWWGWWNEENEVFVSSKPVDTIVQTRGVAVADATPTEGENGGGSKDCLAAGTPVWTERGPVAIEQMRAGDLVLARDVDSGELCYKPVLRTTVRPASHLVRIEAGNETFETSGGHLFWVSGEGWIKSRKLTPGMVLHTAEGPVRVSNVTAGQHAQTYNLVVADFNTYFVGEQKILSHDNTVRRITRSIVPGLAAE